MKMGSTLQIDDHKILVVGVLVGFFCCCCCCWVWGGVDVCVGFWLLWVFFFPWKFKKLIINISIFWETVKKNYTLRRKIKVKVFSAEFLLFFQQKTKKLNIAEDWTQVSSAESHRKPVVKALVCSGLASSYLATISPEELHIKHIHSWDRQPAHEKH